MEMSTSSFFGARVHAVVSVVAVVERRMSAPRVLLREGSSSSVGSTGRQRKGSVFVQEDVHIQAIVKV